MAGTVSFKTLSVVLLMVIVCLLLNNFYLYHMRYQGQPTFLVIQRPQTGPAIPEQLLDTFSKREQTKDSKSYTSWTKNISRAHKQGFLLALKVYEQQTMATGNLIQLQCFASKLNLSVVQPFMKDSFLTTPLDQAQHKDMLQLEDVYNMEEWSKYAEGEGYSPLVRWEEFIEYAPRGVILVQMKYPSLKQVKEIQDSGKIFPHPLSRGEDYKEGCDHTLLEKAVGELRSNSFHVIRKVCYNFMTGNEIPLHVYQDELLWGHNPDMVTIIIDQWRGLKEEQRLLIREDVCEASARHRENIHSSSKVARDAELYANRYLHQNGGANYLAIIARYEMIALSPKGEGGLGEGIISCIKETLKHLHKMKAVTKLKEVFLSVDIGKYGSKSFEKKNYYNHQHDIESFLRRVYKKMNINSIKEWERSFERVTKKVDTGYIAKVQQAIVARAKCVLFVGGGSFQQHALHLYQELHPNSTEWCVKVVKKCTSKYRPVHI